MWAGQLSATVTTKHRIKLEPGNVPKHQITYRQGLDMRNATSKYIRQHLDDGVIEPSTSEWASPMVLVPKKDGSVHSCVDYRRINATTVPDTYPLPRMDLDILGDAKVFITLDSNSGYWKIPMVREEQDNKSFETNMGTYRYKWMHFGLRNAPSTFTRALEIIPSDVLGQICIVYLDEFIIVSTSVE